MKMYEVYHEPGAKYLLNGQVVPSRQTGMEDITDAMDNLHNHPNVGPFIGKALIQLLVTSNPSPQYINNIANAFNNNGSGVREDLASVIRAILLDSEARNCNPLSIPTAGKMREPILRYTGFLKAFNANDEAFFVDELFPWYDATGQVPMHASSVFNFYLPDFQPNGSIATANLVAPVFQIHNSSTSIGYINHMSDWCYENEFLDPDNVNPTADFSDEINIAANATALVNRLDILLACGQLSTATKSIIVIAISQFTDEEDRLELANNLIMMSPDYAILK